MKIDNKIIEGLVANPKFATTQQQAIVQSLKTLLADETILYRRLRNYYASVTGINFYPLYMTFEDHLNEINMVIDKLQERIQRYQLQTAVSMNESAPKARLEAESGMITDLLTMIEQLTADHESIVGSLHTDIETISQTASGASIAELLTIFLERHRRMVWALWLCKEGQFIVEEE